MGNVTWAVDHSGFSVPDLDEAIDLFVDVFGCEVVVECGPYDDVGFVWPGEPAAERGSLRLAILRQGSHNIELLEYRDCESCRLSEPPRPTEVGSGHIAFYVDDIAGAVDELRVRPGMRILGEIITEKNGPLKGLDWVYVLTPWGMLIELIRWPLGMPYQRTTTARLASPPVLQNVRSGG